MTILSRASCRRLQKLPQNQAVWEGDRRVLSKNLAIDLEGDAEIGVQGDCILWIDGAEGVVRAIDIVPSDTGHEAVVRTLLRAMEHPHSSAEPARPSKIVVRDREIQFFLRGALQNLGITIEHVPELPLIDEVFRGLQEHVGIQQPHLPEAYAEALMDLAAELWDTAPWEILDEQQIIAVELNRWDVDTLYLSVLGMMGVEFGILMYRSLDSLQQFRQKVLRADQTPKQMQQAFLEQDCIFLTFDPVEDEFPEYGGREPRSPAPGSWLAEANATVEREPSFGSLHPLEGLRTTLAPEEALVALVALKAFQKFVRQHYTELDQEDWPSLTHQYRLANPELNAVPKTVAVTVSSLPEVALELTVMTSESLMEDAAQLQPPVLQDDFVPDKALVLLHLLPWDWIDSLTQAQPSCYHPAPAAMTRQGKGLPIVLIHTSQPKGEGLIQQIQTAGGLKALCFNPGEDPFSGEDYDLGLVQTCDGIFHLFAEYPSDDPDYQRQRQEWERFCKRSKGRCGVAIAKGVTGKHRGNPQLRDIMALFEVEFQNPEALGLPPLTLQFELDWL